MGVLTAALSRLRRPATEDAPRAPAPPKVSGPADAVLFGAVLALVAFGVVMVYSASAVFASQAYDDGYHFLIRQAIFVAIAIPLMVVVARVDYHRYERFTYPMLALTVGMLVFVALGLGRSAGGAARWIPIGPFNVQPAEIAKVVLIFYLAASLSKKREKIKSFSIGFLPHVLMAAFLGLLCLEQPDFGSAVMIALLTFVLLFTAGARLGYILGAVLIAAPIAALLIVTSGYRMNRWLGFMAPFEHRQDVGYHVSESLLAFGSGGLSGVGLGDSRQKLFFLPEAHTDFISAIIGEELGFVGLMALILVFVLVVVRGVRAAMKAPDEYGTYLATGITLFFGIQAFTNLAVAMGMLPTKGLVLPFISYGGSSLLVNAAAIGVLLNVSRPREVPAATVDESSDAKPSRARLARAGLGGGA